MRIRHECVPDLLVDGEVFGGAGIFMDGGIVGGEVTECLQRAVNVEPLVDDLTFETECERWFKRRDIRARDRHKDIISKDLLIHH